MSINIDELIAMYRECISQCIDVLDKTTFSNQISENLHICKKDCVGHTLKKYFYGYDFVYRSKIPCFIKCFFLYLRHNDSNLLSQCMDKCIWFK